MKYKLKIVYSCDSNRKLTKNLINRYFFQEETINKILNCSCGKQNDKLPLNVKTTKIEIYNDADETIIAESYRQCYVLSILWQTLYKLSSNEPLHFFKKYKLIEFLHSDISNITVTNQIKCIYI